MLKSGLGALFEDVVESNINFNILFNIFNSWFKNLLQQT